MSAGTINIRIPPKLRRELDKLCQQQDRAISDVVRESIRRYVIQEELRQLRERLRPYAEAQGVLTDEDVFRAIS